MDNYHFFWSGPLSNWEPAFINLNVSWMPYGRTVIHDFVSYNCVEQFMMAQKATISGDEDTYQKIMKTDSPKEQKLLGRQVKNFNAECWDLIKRDVVKLACLEKFISNPELGDYLLSTGEAMLVEASPYDRVWGIGFSAADATSNIPDWGENLLGKILVEVRSLTKLYRKYNYAE